MAKQISRKITLVASDEKQPSIKIKPGQELRVTAVSLVGPNVDKLRSVGARLCGGSGTCLALVDIGSDVINPNPTAAKRK